MQFQFDFESNGTNSFALSFGNQETPRIASQDGQQKVVTTNALGSVGAESSLNAKPLTTDLQCGQWGFMSFMSSHSFFIEFSPQ
jgi:hypothetical protein